MSDFCRNFLKFPLPGGMRFAAVRLDRLFAVEQDQRKSSIDHLVTKSIYLMESFLKILTFSDRIEKTKFSFCISELANDSGSNLITLQVFQKTANY